MRTFSDFVLTPLARFPMARWSPIPLRLIVGYGFMQHGFAKLSRGPDMFAAVLQGMGVPAPHLMAWLTILTELLGGLAVLLGAFVAIVSLPMTAVLLVAMFKVHLPYGFSSIKLLAVTATGAKFGPVGYEVILLYVACLMMRGLTEIEWDDITEAAPAVITAIAMPFTFSIAEGIAFGFISYAAIKVVAGRWSDVHPAVGILAVLFVIKYMYI